MNKFLLTILFPAFIFCSIPSESSGMDFEKIRSKPNYHPWFQPEEGIFLNYSAQTLYIPVPIPLPALGLSKIIMSDKNPSSGYEIGIDASFTLFLAMAIVPIIEVKCLKLKYLSPSLESSFYYGGGLGLSLPRIVPVYIAFGKEWDRDVKQPRRMEVSFTMSPIHTYWEFTDDTIPSYWKGRYIMETSSIRFTYGVCI